MPSLRRRTRFALLATALAGLGAARPPIMPGQTYTFDAASSEINYKAQTGVFQNIKISQGKVTVFADRARAIGIGEPNGQWTLVGKVRVHAPPHGNLSSDKAVVEVHNQRITEVTVSGNPAHFSQDGQAPRRLTEGHADQIVYDVTAGTVELNRDAWLSDGRNQISGPQIRYNILKDRIEASSAGPGKRVHISIGPRTLPASKVPAPASKVPAPASKVPAPASKTPAPAKRRPRPPGRSP